MFENKTIVITGGTGSFGSTFCKSSYLKNAKEIKPLIHFSRHEKINKQLNSISKNKLYKYLVEINNLEVSCKLNYGIHELLIKKFLLNLSNY